MCERVANEPRLKLADEPTASLDAANAGLVLEALRQANLVRGVAVVFAYHDAEIDWPGARRRRLRDGVLVPG